MDGADVRVVSPGYLREQGLGVQDPGETIQRLASQGKTVVYVLTDGTPIDAIAQADIIRRESHETVRRLKTMGIKPIMLTGDATPVARWVAGELGLEDYFAEVLQDQKSREDYRGAATRAHGRRGTSAGPSRV